MKKFFISIILAVISFTLFIAACSDPYADYTSLGIKSESGSLQSPDEEDWETFSPYDGIISTAEELREKCGKQLDYSEEFFEESSLVMVLIAGCSSYGIEFVDVLENDGKLYPVLERNYIYPGHGITEDYIQHIFYSEIPKSANYEYGEIITRYRNKPFWFSGCNA